MSKQSFANISSLGMGDYVGVEADNDDNKLLLNRSNGIKTVNVGTYLKSKVVKITSAQLKTLFTNPVTVIDAPGNGYFVGIDSWSARHDAGTAYAGISPSDSLSLIYEGGTGTASKSININGFLNQSTAQIRYINGFNADPIEVRTPVNNGAIQIKLDINNITTGTFDLYLFINYSVIPTDYIV